MRLFGIVILVLLLLRVSVCAECLADTDMSSKMTSKVIKRTLALGHGPYETLDPFLFCVYHKDMYPAGDKDMKAPRRGNGMDFNPKADYRMYHGKEIPGFPEHPHFKLETITATLDGYIDHSDSLGNGGRFGKGDVAIMNAGNGIVHGENFPLIHMDKPNPLRFFQIWLNLPNEKKHVKPDFAMQWAHEVTKFKPQDGVDVIVWLGQFGEHKAGGDLPKESWSADPKNDVGVWHINIEEGKEIEIPAAVQTGVNRALYFVEGSQATVDGTLVKRSDPATMIEVDSSAKFKVKAASGECQFLVLQGKPINQPVVQQGPFVGGSQQDIQEAFVRYRKTEFGGWPWDSNVVIFPREKGRFALMDGVETSPPDGKIL